MHADRRFPSDWNPVLVLGSGSALGGGEGFGLLFFQCPTLPQVYENMPIGKGIALFAVFPAK